jgi:four helix bundle protein
MGQGPIAKGQCQSPEEENMKIESYRHLEVWQKAITLVTEIYRVSRTFPKEEIYGLTAQLRRAAVSVPANIAEGWGRNMTREFIQFLRTARGSLLELETHLLIAKNLEFLQTASVADLLQTTETINKMLNGLVRSLAASTR